MVAAIRARGHGVENHSYSHPNGFALRGPRGLTREILGAQDAIERSGAAGPASSAPRPASRTRGSRPCSRQPACPSSPGPAAASTRSPAMGPASRRAWSAASRAGDILLLHDGSSARDGNGRPVVLEALPRVLDEMSRKGLRSEALHAVLEKP